MICKHFFEKVSISHTKPDWKVSGYLISFIAGQKSLSFISNCTEINVLRIPK